MSKTTTIEYQVAQTVLMYRKFKQENPDFSADIMATIRGVELDDLKKYADFCKTKLNDPFEIMPFYWISRTIEPGLTISINSVEMKKETIYKPIM